MITRNLKNLAAALAVAAALLPTAGAAATVSWIGGSGDWETAANWSTGALPGATDDVVIPAGTAITVTHSTGSDTVNSVVCHQTFTLSGGTVAVSTTLQTDSTLNLSGGTLGNATVQTQNGAALVVGGSGTLDGVTVDGTVDVGSTYNQAVLTVLDGLTLNGTMLVGNPGNQWWGRVNFAGSQELSGNGTVVFGNSGGGYGYGSGNSLLEANGASTLVIGPEIEVRGQNGWIGYNVNFNWGAADASVVNQGTIASGEGTISVAGASLGNGGTLEATNGGVIQPASAATINSGIIRIDSGTMTFANGFTQTTGTLDFGLNSPTDFGHITFGGGASLGGTLAAHLGPNYIPNSGDSFAVLNYGNNSPAFTNLSLPRSNNWMTNAGNGVLTLVAGAQLPIGVSISPANSILAVGSTLTLQATAEGPGPFGYQWIRDGANIVGATNSSLTLTNVSKAAAGTYTVSVSDSGGSNISAAPAQIQVLAPPGIVAFPQSQTAWIGANLELNVAVSGDPTLAIQWRFNGVNITGATNSSLSFSDVTRAQAGSYSVAVTNLVGAVTSSTPAVVSVVTGPVCPEAPAGMVAWWRGEGDTSDYAGTNDAVFEGTAAFAAGEVGQAFGFDGAGSFLQVPNNPLWNFGTNDFSFEFWANFAQIFPSLELGDGSVVFLAHDEESGTRDKWIFGFGGGEIYFYVYDTEIGPRFLAQAPFNPQTNQWYHLGLTKASGVFRLFENGQAVSVQTNNTAIPAASAPLTIGQAQGLFMAGSLDEVSIYNRALAPGEMLGIFAAGSAGKCESAPPLTIGRPGFDASGQFQFQILGGAPGSTVHVESSPDLAHWSNVWQAVLTGNTLIFTDTNPAPPSRLFYRAVVNP